MKDPEKVKQGKRNRAAGADFERRTRKNLEEKGWMVSKYQNNLNYEFIDDNFNGDYVSIPARASKFRLSSTGFPDLITYKIIGCKYCMEELGLSETEDIETSEHKLFDVQFYECKVNGQLSKEERQKAKWYLDNNHCSKFYIVSKQKVKNRIHIIYTDFNDYMKNKKM